MTELEKIATALETLRELVNNLLVLEDGISLHKKTFLQTAQTQYYDLAGYYAALLGKEIQKLTSSDTELTDEEKSFARQYKKLDAIRCIRQRLYDKGKDYKLAEAKKMVEDYLVSIGMPVVYNPKNVQN